MIVKLNNFTLRFKEILVHLTRDLRHDVGVMAMKILIEIVKEQSVALSDKDFEGIYELVLITHQPLAQLAGKFLHIYLSGLTTSEEELIKAFVHFFFESNLPRHVELFVDSVIDDCEVMKNWEIMTDLLLDDDESDENSFDKEKKTTLINIMIASIKQAATGKNFLILGENSSHKK